MAKKAAAPKADAPAPAAAKPAARALSRTQVVANIAETTSLSRKQVTDVMEALKGEIQKALDKKKGVGQFKILDLVKITRETKPARPAKKGVPNPFRPGETMDVAAKPASDAVKVRPLKGLRDMVPTKK